MSWIVCRGNFHLIVDVVTSVVEPHTGLLWITCLSLLISCTTKFHLPAKDLYALIHELTYLESKVVQGLGFWYLSWFLLNKIM